MQKVKLGLFLVGAIAAGVLTLFGQGASGKIVGTVTDISGAVVPDASVTIKNMGTSVYQETKTSSAGTYSVPYLNPGTYQVSVTMKGFEQSSVQSINLAVDQTVRVDVQLKPGTVTQQVTVAAHAVALDTENATVGQVITSRQTADLPLNGRNFTQLLLLGPGAVKTGGEQATRPNSGDAISLMGARPSSNQYLIDGVTANDTTYQTPAIIPSIDAIQEFKEQTKTYSAAFGTSANQINISIKSGTNQVHGTVYDFLRNDALDARNFFDKNIAPLRRNQFGYTLGGPVYIPKLYDGRNKTFFFANYEGERLRQSATVFGTVPTQTERNGIFSTPITDPFTGLNFPGNQIPSTSYSRLAQVDLPLIPLPNANLPQGNLEQVIPTPSDSDQQIYRFDENLGTKDRFFFRYTKYNFISTLQSGLTPIADQILTDITHNYVVGYTHVFSPSMVNEFHWGYLRAKADKLGVPPPSGVISNLSLTGLFPNLEQNAGKFGIGFPSIGLNNTPESVASGAVNVPWHNTQPTTDITDSLAWNKGKHQLTFGFEMRRWALLNNTTTGFLGQWTFDGTFTGVPFADFLLGIPQQVWATQPAPRSVLSTPGTPIDVHYGSLAPYIQDDWNITSRLTLDIGLRYDYSSLPYEQNNKWSWFDPNIPGGGLCVADKSLIADGYGGNLYKYCGSRTAGQSQKMVFAPRFGFAYRPFGTKTVVRGGYGVFFDTAEAFEDIGSGNIYPFLVRGTYYSYPGGPYLQSDNLFQPIAPGVVTPADLSFYEPQARRKFDPYVQEWSLSVQRELTPNTKLDVSYVGSKGTHLNMRGNPNQPFPYDPAHPSSVLARTPYPNFALMVESFWEANSNYNAMNVTLHHRTSNLLLVAAYTWGRSMDDKSAAAAVTGDQAGWAGPMDFHNWSLDYARSTYDVKNRFVMSFVYNLPVGRGKKLLGGISGPANALLGGWQVNGIYQLQGGFPFSEGATDVNNLNLAYGQRADCVGNPYPSGFHSTPEEWFNTAAFAQPALGLFGNCGRNSLRGPGINDLDISIFKNVPIKERLTWQFRVEAFNSLNHTQFNLPTASVAAGSLNGVVTSAKPPRIVQLAMKFIW